MLGRRTSRILGLVAPLALALGMGLTGPAQAAAPSQSHVTVRPSAVNYYGGSLQDQNTGRCIDDSGAYGLRAFSCNGLNYQTWYATYFGSWFSLTNGNTGRCIDDSLAYGLRSFDCNLQSYQNWQIIAQYGDGSQVLQNQNTGRCIDDSGAYGLRSFPCNYQSYQRWY
ncbi:hypothetical protein GCM10009760_25030 [Kitasatospora kazusensis]|uniref:Ricin B lectin domain-containing protein n=1 Tax=Kitasatospora kazusensis TaxID=407974 RepID=A0ABN2ZET5_9ACTN